MSINNKNNRSRSSSLPPLRSVPVRATALPSASSPIMEQAGEINNNTTIEMVNGRISVLEDLIRTLITALPIEGSATTSATVSSNISLPEPFAGTVAPTIEKRFVSKKNYTQTSQSVKDTFKANRIDMNCKDSFVRISMIRGALTTAALKSMLDGH